MILSLDQLRIGSLDQPRALLCMISNITSLAPADTHICATESPLVLLGSILSNYITWGFSKSLFYNLQRCSYPLKTLGNPKKRSPNINVCVE